MNNSRETCAMFELMETSEQVSKDKHLLKKNISDANHDNHFRKRKGGAAKSPTNPEKSHSGNPRKKNVVSPIEKTSGVDKT